MSTHLYAVRVLAVAPDELRARFRVFVTYYDAQYRGHALLPGDPSFFFQILWEAGRRQPAAPSPLLRKVGVNEIRDPGWLAAESHRYVRRVQQTVLRNHPVSGQDWTRLEDFYWDRDGELSDADLLVQADYDVTVTDPRWLETLSPGDIWNTASDAILSDQVLTDDAPVVLDLREPEVILAPFPGGETAESTPGDLAFSDDGRYLAVTNQACQLVLFRTDDWSEHARIEDGSLWGQGIQWVPGTHQITGRDIEGDGERDGGAPARAYDVGTGTEVDLPRQQRREARSRTGPHGDDGRAVRPDGAYYVATSGGGVSAGEPENEQIDLWRVSDRALLMRCRSGGRHVGGLSWSPDGGTLAASVLTGHRVYGAEVRIYHAGPPLEAPLEEGPSAGALRQMIKESYDPGETVLLYDKLIERTENPAAEAAFRLGAMAAEACEHERAVTLLEWAVSTGQPEFSEAAAELLAGLNGDTEAIPEEG